MDNKMKAMGEKFVADFNDEQLKVLAELHKCLENLYGMSQKLEGIPEEGRVEIVFQNSMALLSNIIINTCRFYLGKPPSREEFALTLQHILLKHDKMSPAPENDSARPH